MVRMSLMLLPVNAGYVQYAVAVAEMDAFHAVIADPAVKRLASPLLTRLSRKHAAPELETSTTI